ncbi:MAG TPA: asparaginase [Bauldia sp.]|nr:asparaginase [Bauldia sp.]
MAPDPFLVEVTRGTIVESRHRGAIVIADASGRRRAAIGDVEQAVFPRSAVKALQALPLVESGAADAFGFGNAELALACASHNGERRHTETAASMLAKAGRGVADLECGAHMPIADEAMRQLIRAGKEPTALHNNCSGKHAGFVCLACHQGIDPKGYVAPEHPVQREITAALSAMTATRLEDSNRAVDGCSIPTYAIPLDRLAVAFARFITGERLSPARAVAARRLAEACTADPFMVAGTARFDTEVMSAMPGKVFTKTGAEGVFCAAFQGLGLGVALKCDDGAGRAADIAMAAVIEALLPEADGRFSRKPVLSRKNVEVGEIRPAEGLVAAIRAG